MGADSAESAHSRDDGDSALSDVAPEDIGGDEEDEEVVAVNASGRTQKLSPGAIFLTLKINFVSFYSGTRRLNHTHIVDLALSIPHVSWLPPRSDF